MYKTNDLKNDKKKKKERLKKTKQKQAKRPKNQLLTSNITYKTSQEAIIW